MNKILGYILIGIGILLLYAFIAWGGGKGKYSLGSHPTSLVVLDTKTGVCYVSNENLWIKMDMVHGETENKPRKK